MKLRLLNILSGLSLITFLITSCSKEGPAGATGPAGPQGAQGPAGTAGTPGATGPAGTANVIYSDWLNVTFDGTDSTGWFADIDAPRLVDSILSKGDIKVYLNAGSDSADNQLVIPLPVYDLFATGDVINAYFQPQLITLASTLDESSFTNANGYHYFQYRYILIPGGTRALRPLPGQTTTGIDWNDYKQVKKYLGLKD